LPPDVEASATNQAAKDGLPLQDYVASLVREGIERRIEVERLATLSFSKLLAPVRREFKESGMTEEELESLVEETHEEIWQEKQSLRK